MKILPVFSNKRERTAGVFCEERREKTSVCALPPMRVELHQEQR